MHSMVGNVVHVRVLHLCYRNCILRASVLNETNVHVSNFFNEKFECYNSFKISLLFDPD